MRAGLEPVFVCSLPELKTVDGIATVGPIQGWFEDPDGKVIGVLRLGTPS